MLVIETYLKYSEGKGLGMFSMIDLKKDTLYWVRNTKFDHVFTTKSLVLFNPITQLHIQKYAFLEANNKWYLCTDDSKYTNHSDNPNTYDVFNNKGLLVESRILFDIKAGDEIFCDYKKICLTCKFGVHF